MEINGVRRFGLSAIDQLSKTTEVSTTEGNPEHSFVQEVASTARSLAGCSTAHFPRIRTIFG